MNEVIFNYFSYLRDASRKLGSYGDFYRCLMGYYSKGFSNVVAEVDRSFIESGVVTRTDDLSGAFSSYLKQIKKEHNRQVFLGVGCVAGGLKKRVLGSLINIPVILDEAGFIGGKLKFRLDYENKMINYDLLSSLLPDYFVDEFDETSSEILELLAILEDTLRKKNNLNDFDFIVDSFLGGLADINDNMLLSKFEKKLPYEELVDIKNKNCPLNKKEFFYYGDVFHLFISEMPDSISTFKSLDLFCDELSGSGFKSSVLSEFFANVFNFNMPIGGAVEQVDYVSGFDKYFPLSLSKNQKLAINNCFNSRISYVQGPPGTGKSHTISGILLASFLLNKKVLVVAQKKNALEVVAQKISGFFDESLAVPFIHFNKEDKGGLKKDLLELCSVGSPEDEELDLLGIKIKNTEKKINEVFALLGEREALLKKCLNGFGLFCEKNEEFIERGEVLFNNPVYGNEVKKRFILLKTGNIAFLANIKKIEDKFKKNNAITKFDELLLLNLEKKFLKVFDEISISFVELVKKRLCYGFLKDLFEVSFSFGQIESVRTGLESQDYLSRIRYEISTLEVELEKLKRLLFKQYHKRTLFQNVKDEDINFELQKFGKLLHWQNGEKVVEKMKYIDYSDVLRAYPVWLSEIRNIGEVLPNQAEMFDLVVVDEASQVNLAEILPVFYRAKHICVIGDHQQLGLNSVGLSFSLSKKFDKIVWNKYQPNGLSFDEASKRSLNVTKASVLDLLRSEENLKMFKFVMLDEHYRSLPGLANFNNKYFYDGKIKLMTEVPEKSLVPCFCSIKVDGKRLDKVNDAEALKVIEVIKFLIKKKDLLPERLAELKSVIKLNDFIPERPTIGVVSAVRNQVEHIKDLLEEFSENDFDNHRLFCGTPEELQGDEFDIVIMSSTTDDVSRNNGHYNNENRFNVATSRSRYFTFFIYSDVTRIPLYDKYLNYFGVVDEGDVGGSENVLGWGSKVGGGLKEVISHGLKEIISEFSDGGIEIFADVSVCGQKPLSFVVYDKNSKKSAGIEIEGFLGKDLSWDDYASSIMGKDKILKKSGWEIIHTSYQSWFLRGSISVNSRACKDEKIRLSRELKKILGY